VPSSTEVSALVYAYRQQGRKPQLEFLPGRAPAVEAALIAAGFVVEGRLPLMVCTPGAAHDLQVQPGIELLAPSSDGEFLAMVAAQNESYGDPPPASDAARGQRARVAEGEMAIMARDALTGAPAGGGVCTVPEDGTTELAGVGVRVAYRRRGIAAALAGRLVHDAFAAGLTTVFLMAAHEAEARIYQRAGFTIITEILHISQPSV
jgi:ribosomal protein S18 acetylase RimI-like enzyme